LAQPQKGNTVAVHYTGRLEDGTVFDSSKDGDPLRFTLGEGQVIPGFEQAILDLEPGQTGTTRISPEEGYGPHRAELIVAIPREQLPPEIQPEIGQHFQLTVDQGNNVPVVVKDVSETSVTFDANHPLAGKTLVFDLELVEITS
jgi:peptidylprolyl isomerase